MPSLQCRGLVISSITLGLVMSGCSGTSQHQPPQSGSGATTSVAPASTTSSTIDAALDQARATSLVLTTSDLPGWNSAPHQQDPSEASTSAEVATCLGVPDSFPDRDAHANSPDFSMGSSLQVQNDVAIFRRQRDVDADKSAVAGPKANGCLTTLAREQVLKSTGPGTTIQGLQLNVTAGAVPGRPLQVAMIQTTITLAASGVSVTVYDTNIYLAAPRLEESLDFTSDGQPFPSTQLDSIATTAETRLAATA